MELDERIEMEVCVDCLMVDANGESEGIEPEALARIEKAYTDATADGWYYANNCDENCEGWFSWSPCGFCGSTLGGDRHPAVLLKS
jgi:hypothetical protein